MTVDPKKLTFIVVGCQRCGTTWIDAALREHPAVFLPPQKQTYFFDRHWERGPAWYLENFRDVGDSHQAVGEVATGYCLLEAVPRMAEMLPHVQLIMSMRHPVDRAFSYFLSRRGEMGWGDFEQAVDESEDLLARGRYMEQIERLLEHYPRQRLQLVFYDDLQTDDRAFLQQILEFLGLNGQWESSMLGQIKNSAMFPRLRRTLHGIGLKPALAAAARGPMGDVVRRIRKRSGARDYAQTMDSEIRQRLIDHFRPYNQQLAAFTGRDLDHWNR